MTTATLVAISGNTYPVKDQIKALGGRWDADRRCWMVPADKADAARALVAGAGKPSYTPTATRPAYRPTRCRECGVHASSLRAPYEKILRNGLCSGCNSDRRAGYGD